MKSTEPSGMRPLQQPLIAGREAFAAPALPPPAGPLSAAVLATIAQPDLGAPAPRHLYALPGGVSGPVLLDDDFQLALYVLYELHYRGFAGVAEEWEWNPPLIALRASLERRFLLELIDLVGPPLGTAAAAEIDLRLRAIVDADDGPSLSRYVESRATLEQFLEFVTHRSAYQLKEADPHAWALPRLSGAPKAALVEIECDEYGEGELHSMHAELFRQTMLALGLDATYGAHLDRLPGSTLATVNLMSLFGLHRRWRGALVGHLAAFEMSSPLPNRRYGNGLLRLGAPQRARAFYDVHVTADAVHEQIAAVDLAGGLIEQEPQLAADVMFGARALVALEASFARYLLDCWGRGESSLRAARSWPAAGESPSSRSDAADGSAASPEAGSKVRRGELGAQKPIAL